MTRKIARIMNDHFGTEMGKTSIARWIQTFVPRISEYARTLTPELSDTWHADELFVKMKGGDTRKSRTGDQTDRVAYLWNVMDRKTRFLLASKLSKYRDAIGGERAFKEAIGNAHDSRPERIFTDALHSYNDAVRFSFGGKVEHIANAGVRKTHANSNRIKRINGTLRERVKVQRGWKNMTSQIAEGQRLHYNFVKPHQALEGQTPAERAGLVVEGQNKWLGLMKAAIASKGETSN